MISKNEVKYIQSLFDKKNRDAENVFVAEGPKLVQELLKSNFTIKKIYAINAWMQQNIFNSIATEISESELKTISNLQTPNQVLAIVEKKNLPKRIELEGKINLMLDGIQDPGNLGTIIRIADWFGLDTIIASGDTADLYNPKVVQSTMGSITRVNVYYTHLKEVLKTSFLISVYGALLNGKSVYELKQIKEAIIIIGNESKGIRDTILPYVMHPVTIPRKGNAESLNAAVACGIILSHITK